MLAIRTNPRFGSRKGHCPCTFPQSLDRFLEQSTKQCDSLSCNVNGRFNLTEFAINEPIPPYAILSHTWGADDEEVTFEDLTNDTGQSKPGYEKLQFCGEQARADGLQYFWFDTCCIDKTNRAELSHAIKYMFRWYRKANRCYVYLSDVCRNLVDTTSELNVRWYETEFRKSKWFSRGWTLQELLAPHPVEFFSQDRERLGDKSTLRQLHEITGIPKPALQGVSLSHFSVNERLSWTEGRETKLEEDKVYSLLGIFDVYMAPLYGEGTASAFKRLMEEIDKLERCLQDLHLTDPETTRSALRILKVAC